MCKGPARRRTSLGWQAGSRRWYNGGGGHEGGIKAGRVVYKWGTCHNPGKEENRGTWGKYGKESGEKYVG